MIFSRRQSHCMGFNAAFGAESKYSKQSAAWKKAAHAGCATKSKEHSLQY